MLNGPHYPWVFRRDEVDLLEDQIEDLFHRYQGVEDGIGEEGILTMEQEVLREQLHTEEQADAELSQRLGESWFHSTKEHSQTFLAEELPPISVASLMQEMHRHPLYVQARDWSVLVFQYAKKRYDHDGVRSRELFCVYANVNLVPIKLATALTGELQEDGFTLEIAVQDYQLATVYLERVTACLDHVATQEIHDHSIKKMSSIGNRLLKVIRARLMELQRRIQNQGQGL